MLADPGIPFRAAVRMPATSAISGDTYDDSFSCNDKLIGAYAFLETNLYYNGPDVGEYCTSPTTAIRPRRLLGARR